MNATQRVVLLLLTASLLAGVVFGSPFYYRLAYVWIFLYAGSWLLSKMSLRGLEVKRTARFLRSQVGQIFEERVEVLNHTRWPKLWVEVKDESALPGSRGSQVLSMIRGGEGRSYLVRTRLLKRGVFHLGPTTLASGDLFGLFPTNRSVPAQETLLVYPMMVDIRAFPSPVGWLSGGEALRRRTQQITANAAGVREYAPGDPLNRIHWMSTARRNRFMVKEFELDPMAEVWIFVDANRSVHSELPAEPARLDEKELWRPSVKIPLTPSTEEYAVSIAASLSRYYLQRGRIVGLVSSGRNFRVLPAERGGRQLGKTLESLALLHAEGRLPLQALVEAEIRSLPRGSTMILITPDSSKGIPLACELVMRRGMRPVVILLDATSFGGGGAMDAVSASLEIMGVPLCKVANGDDLSAALSENGNPQLWI